MNILGADIGGTKTLLRLSRLQNGNLQTLAEKRFASGDYDRFEDMLAAFLNSQSQTDVAAACLGLAGPIEGRRGRVTNLPWLLDADRIGDEFAIAKLSLLNDFAAIAHAIPALDAGDQVTLQQGDPVDRAPIAVLGAGTGLGQALMTWCGHRYQVIPTEGGHSHFAPTDEEQMALLRFLLNKYDRVSNERLLSGQGLVNIFDFMRSTRNKPVHQALQDTMQQNDPAKIIAQYAAEDKDTTAVAAMGIFCRIYGQCAGDLALTTLARGGVYVAGGIAAKNLDALRRHGFIKAFNQKGRMAALTSVMPVHVITNMEVGLIGAERMARLLAEGELDAD